MSKPSAELTALVGSRICHDLISPIGAIGNGVELLQMSGAQGPEVALIGESVENASARVRFFRMAFGASGADQQVSRREASSILDDLQKGGRITARWQVAEDLPRALVQLAFLALLCCESALPLGGDITVSGDSTGLRVTATGKEIRRDGDLWDRLERPAGDSRVAPAHVQFALLPVLARGLDRSLKVDSADGQIAIAF